MKQQLMLVVAGLSALTACSGSRERPAPPSNRIAATPDLTLPDTVSRKDTSVTLSSRNQQSVSPVEQQVPPTAQPAKPKAKTTRRPRVSRPVASVHSRSAEDTAVRGYAPGGSPHTPQHRDSSASTDSSALASAAGPAPVDTTQPQRDTLARSAETTRDSAGSSPAPAGAPARRDTATGATSDSSMAPPDSVARDTVAAPGPTADADRASAAPPAPPTQTGTVASRTLPVGTEIHAALDDSITSRRDTVGRQVSAHIMENVVGPDGRTLIAAGTPVQFTITGIRPSRSKSSQGRLALRADGISLGGHLQSVQADVRPVPRELRGRGVTGSEAAKVGGGAAAGAVIGGVVGNTKGAVIGGVAGAAAGAVVASQTATRDVVVKAKTPVVLVLTAPLVAP
jgi:outer membrane lipoprotein SlyB